MEEENYMDQLDRFAKESGLEYYSNSKVKKNTLIPGNKFTKTEFVVFDLPDAKDKLHLVFSDIVSSRLGSSSAYCGLFLNTKYCRNEIKVRPRFFIDRLSFAKRHKTGNSFVDKKAIIFRSNRESIPIKTDSGIIRKFLELNKTIQPMELVSLKNSFSSIPLLHGKNWIALIINGSWLLDLEKLKIFTAEGSKLLLKAHKS
jgi:hypothetical protein